MKRNDNWMRNLKNLIVLQKVKSRYADDRNQVYTEASKGLKNESLVKQQVVVDKN